MYSSCSNLVLNLGWDVYFLGVLCGLQASELGKLPQHVNSMVNVSGGGGYRQANNSLRKLVL